MKAFAYVIAIFGFLLMGLGFYFGPYIYTIIQIGEFDQTATVNPNTLRLITSIGVWIFFEITGILLILRGEEIRLKLDQYETIERIYYLLKKR